MLFRRFVLLAALAAALPACGTFQLGVEPPATRVGATAIPTLPGQIATAPPTATPSEPTAAITNMPVAQEPLNWLLVKNEAGLWAVKTDGTGQTQITNQYLVGSFKHGLAPLLSPTGEYLAFISSATSEMQMPGSLILNVFSFPALQPLTQTIIYTPPPNPEGHTDSMRPEYESHRAMTTQSNLAWSPDGRQLAYLGDPNNTSADVYVYSVATRQVTRLTDGPSQAYAPTWSPDGQFIVHLGADSFGTGAGYTMAGIWAARADGSAVKELYSLDPRAGDEMILDWPAPHSFLAATWTAVFGPQNLRIYNLDTGESQSLWPGCFDQIETAPDKATVLLTVNEWLVDCSGQAQPGTYLVSTAADSPSRVLAEPFTQINWQPRSDVFLGRTDTSVQTVDPTGGYATLVVNKALPLNAAAYFEKRIWAWTEDEATPAAQPGVWLAQPPAAPRQIFNQAAYWPTLIDRQTLIFFSHGMYLARGPDFIPTLVNPQLAPGPEAEVMLIQDQTWLVTP